MNREHAGCLALLLIASLLNGQTSSSASALLSRGLALARVNRLEEAKETFQRGARQYPEDKRFPLELAGIAYRQQANGKAKDFLRRALRLDQGDAYGTDFLATLYTLDGNLPAALKYWNRIGKPVVQGVHFEPDLAMSLLLRERTFAISGGQMFSRSRLENTNANLRRLNILAETQFELVEHKQDDRSELLIRTVPYAPPLAGWLGQILPVLRQLPYQGLVYDLFDFRGSGINLNALGRWDPDKRRVNIRLRGPLRGNPRIEYHYFADLRDETWNLQDAYFPSGIALDALSFRKAQAGGEFEIGLSPRLQWTLGASFAYRTYRNVPNDSLFTRGWSAEIDNRFDYKLWSWPERRLNLDSFASLRTGRFFGSPASRLITTRAGTRVEWRPQAKADRYFVTAQLQAGRTFGNVPLDELFTLGMERDNDRYLWLRGVAGTRDGRKGSAPMGREYAIAQVDVSRKLFELPLLKVFAGPFFDAGSVGDASHRLGSHGPIYDAGLQATVKTSGAVQITFVYGRDLVNGRGVFYTAVSR